MITSKLDANQIQKLSFDEANEAVRSIGIGGKLVPDVFDAILLAYDGSDNITMVTYQSGGDTVAVLNLVYDGSNRLTSVTRA